MMRLFLLLLVTAVVSATATARAEDPPPRPPAVSAAKPGPRSDPASAKAPAFPADETLTYTINWPTGLSLGEARLRTVRRNTPEGPRVETAFHLDASVPGFPVLEDHRSIATGDFCSVEFDKKYSHGKRKADEKMMFDQQNHTATRETKDGGKSDLSTPTCAKDALAYLGYIRTELSNGRLPPHQPVYYGAAYELRVEFTGTFSVKVNDAPINADRILATLKGPKADITFETFFTKDAARTPVLVRVPLSLATFSMELVR